MSDRGVTQSTDSVDHSPKAIARRADRLRRDEFEKVEVADADYTCWRWKVGGKEPSGKPTRIGKWTFATKMVRDIVLDHIDGRVLNACAGETKLRKRGCDIVRNDIDEDIDADLHVDVRDVHKHFPQESFDSVILDPPFDPGRAAKLYEGWHGQEYNHARDAVGQLVKPGGTVVELGWNSYGLHDVNDDERPSWERQAWYVYPQASFKGDVHLKIDRKVNQQRLVTDGGQASQGDTVEHFDGGAF